MTKVLTNDVVSTTGLVANASNQFSHSFDDLANGDYRVTVVITDNQEAIAEMFDEVTIIALGDGDGDGETDGNTDGDGDGETDGNSDDMEEVKNPVSSSSSGATTPTFIIALGMLLMFLRRKRK